MGESSDSQPAEGSADGFAAQERREFREALLSWYDRHRRDLPWRGVEDPYKTWVAEMMLQQTQVGTVVDYFRRWMQRFPDVESVARAEIDEVLELWQGLGYYRRARYLHRSARRIVEEYGGQLPETADELEELTGIGPYTAGAIASIAFEQPAPLVDGNVERVLSRLRAIEGDPKSTANQKVYWRLAEQLVDSGRPGDFNQAMMELGATVCTPQNPSCLICPVRQHCEGFEAGDPEAYPAPAKRARQKPMSVATGVVSRPAGGGDFREYLVIKRPADGLLGGLWEFPSVELDEDAVEEGGQEARVGEALEGYLGDSLQVEARHRRDAEHVGQLTHLFSHIRMTIYAQWRPVGPEARADSPAGRPIQWVGAGQLEDVAMSAAMRRVWQLVDGQR